MSDEKTRVVLREVVDSDLPVFFQHLRDPQAAALAAIDPNDQHAFQKRWANLRRDEQAVPRTIEDADTGEVLGYIIGFHDGSDFRVEYWVDRAHWGQGVATGALAAFLEEVDHRPVYARTPRHNEPAGVVLKRNGFNLVGENTGYSDESRQVMDELIFRLG